MVISLRIFIYLCACFYLKTHHTVHWGSSNGETKAVPFLKASVADQGLEPRLSLLTQRSSFQRHSSLFWGKVFYLNDLYCALSSVSFIPWHCNHIGLTDKCHEIILLLSTQKCILHCFYSCPTCLINSAVCFNFFASLWSHHPFKVWQGTEQNMLSTVF